MRPSLSNRLGVLGADIVKAARGKQEHSYDERVSQNGTNRSRVLYQGQEISCSNHGSKDSGIKESLKAFFVVFDCGFYFGPEAM